MTEDEYNKGLCAIKDEYQQKREDLSNRFIQQNHRFEIEDIIEDKFSHLRIKIESIYVEHHPFSGWVDIKYYGYAVSNDNEVEVGKWGNIFQKDAELIKRG
jgi:hypothetical protein